MTTRRVKLAIARVDPWSVMKMSFLLAVAAGIAGVVLTAVLWLILSGMGVFSDIDRVVGEIQPSTTTAFTLMNYIGFGRVVSLSIVLGVIDIILMTALATLGGVPLQHLLGARRRDPAHADRRLIRARPRVLMGLPCVG